MLVEVVNCKWGPYVPRPHLISSFSSSLLLLHLPDFLAQCCKFFGVFVYVCLSPSRDRRYNLAESRGPREHSRTEQCRWGNEIYMFVSVILTGVCKSTKEKTGGEYRENCVLCIWDDWCMEVVEVKRGHVCLMLTHCFSALAILSVFLFCVRFQLPSLCTWIQNVQCYSWCHDVVDGFCSWTQDLPGLHAWLISAHFSILFLFIFDFIIPQLKKKF